MSDDDTSISLSRGNGSFKSYSTRHGVGCWGKYPTGLVILNWDLSPIPGTENPQPETVDKEPEIPTQDKLQTQWVLKPRHVKLSKPRKVLKQSEERSQLKLSSFPRSRVQAVARTLFDDVKSKNDKVDFNELNQIVREMGLEPSNADLQQIRSTINFEEGDVIPQTTSFDDINQPISNWFTQHVLDLLAELASMSQVAGKLRVLKTVNAEFLRKEWSTAIPPADATPSLISTLEEMVRISICEKKRIPNSHTSTETDSCQQIFLSPLKEWTMLTLDEVAWRQGCMVKCERLNENTTSANCIGVTQFRIKSVALVRKLGTFIGLNIIKLFYYCVFSKKKKKKKKKTHTHNKKNNRKTSVPRRSSITRLVRNDSFTVFVCFRYLLFYVDVWSSRAQCSSCDVFYEIGLLSTCF